MNASKQVLRVDSEAANKAKSPTNLRPPLTTPYMRSPATPKSSREDGGVSPDSTISETNKLGRRGKPRRNGLYIGMFASRN
jgi:hypothetical protein